MIPEVRRGPRLVGNWFYLCGERVGNASRIKSAECKVQNAAAAGRNQTVHRRERRVGFDRMLCYLCSLLFEFVVEGRGAAGEFCHCNWVARTRIESSDYEAGILSRA